MPDALSWTIFPPGVWPRRQPPGYTTPNKQSVQPWLSCPPVFAREAPQRMLQYVGGIQTDQIGSLFSSTLNRGRQASAKHQSRGNTRLSALLAPRPRKPKLSPPTFTQRKRGAFNGNRGRSLLPAIGHDGEQPIGLPINNLRPPPFGPFRNKPARESLDGESHYSGLGV